MLASWLRHPCQITTGFYVIDSSFVTSSAAHQRSCQPPPPASVHPLALATGLTPTVNVPTLRATVAAPSHPHPYSTFYRRCSLSRTDDSARAKALLLLPPPVAARGSPLSGGRARPRELPTPTRGGRSRRSSAPAGGAPSPNGAPPVRGALAPPGAAAAPCGASCSSNSRALAKGAVRIDTSASPARSASSSPPDR